MDRLDALYEAAFNQAATPSALVDGMGRLTVWNAAFDALFRSIAGAGPERLAGSILDFVSSRGGIRLDYYAAEILLGGRPSIFVESAIEDQSGSKRTLRFALSRVEAPAATAALGGSAERYMLFSVEDVTERVLREKRLQAARDEAEKATQTKSQFLANMSHEIRTPIQTILGVVELLEETDLNSEQADYSRQVRFSADVLLGLINDILDFSKIEAGKFDLETTNFDIRSCIQQSADLLVMDAHRKGLEIIVDVDESLPALVRGDPVRLRQIVVNLFKNAVKFTREGSVTLALSRVELPAGPAMRCEVADTGPGVPEPVRDRLFTPFFQGDFAQARKVGGTGLGLAISRHLVELMGGRIGLRPNFPCGSVFWFELPLVAPEYSAAPRPIATGQGSRLLVVDDHPEARAFAARTASSAGYCVTEAGSGEAALDILREAAAAGEGFSLCLVDESMPRMDGWRLASEITGDTAINSARLILMAPVGTIGAEAKMKLLRWFNGYISKPVRPNELLEALQKALSSEVDLESAEGGGPPAAAAEAEPFEGEVLVAEDHEVNRELFTILLGRLGCKVTTARDGFEAAEIGSSRPFDLVLMDIFMPRMNGYEASQALRARGFKGPIVAVTASALKGERENCIAAGMNDILVKPFKKKDLADILAQWLPRPVLLEPIDEEAGTPEPVRIPEGEKGGGIPGAVGAGGPAPGPAPGGAGGAAPGAAPAQAALPPTVPSGMNGGPEVFDWEGVLETFLGQRETVVGLLGRFIVKARGQAAELSSARKAGDFPKFMEVAHSMKGAAWNLCARELGNAALEAERAGRAGDSEAARAAEARVLAAFADFERAAGPFAASGVAASSASIFDGAGSAGGPLGS